VDDIGGYTDRIATNGRLRNQRRFRKLDDLFVELPEKLEPRMRRILVDYKEWSKIDGNHLKVIINLRI